MPKSSQRPKHSARAYDREVLYGITPVEAALAAERRALHKLWAKRNASNARVEAVVRRAEAMGLPVVASDAEELARRAHSRLHQGLVLGCGPLPMLALSDLLQLPAPIPFVLALDQIEDPQNLGGLVRTAAFLGATAVLLHRSHRAPLSASVSKASAGVLEQFPVAEVGNLADALQRLEREGWTVIGSALDDGAVDYRQLRPQGPCVLVMGNEGRGLRPLTLRRCQHLVRIERRGRVESLNVTVAAGVLLAQLIADPTRPIQM